MLVRRLESGIDVGELVRKADELFYAVKERFEAELRDMHRSVVSFHNATRCWPLGLSVSVKGVDLYVDGVSVWKEPRLLTEARRRVARVRRVLVFVEDGSWWLDERVLDVAGRLERAVDMARVVGFDGGVLRRLVGLVGLLRVVGFGLLRWKVSILARFGCWDRGPVWSVPWGVLLG